MLDKRGNLNCDERIDLVNRFIRLFGTSCIDCLGADREFVGDEWINFLNDNNIRYYIRIRNNFKIFLPHKNKEIKAFWLFNSLKRDDFLLIFDAQGRFVFSQAVKPGRNAINVQNLPAGLYFTRLRQAGMSGKFVVR